MSKVTPPAGAAALSETVKVSGLVPESPSAAWTSSIDRVGRGCAVVTVNGA